MTEQMVEIKPTWPEVLHHTADGVYIKQLFFPVPGITMGQHAHAYDHAHLVALGMVRVWKDDVLLGDFKQGDCIHIEAGKKHRITSLTQAIGYCIHNLHGKEDLEIVEKYPFPK